MSLTMAIDPDGPRERLQRLEAEALSDVELVALLLGAGRAGEGVRALSENLLTEHGGLAGLSRARLGELAERPGVGLAKGARIVAAVEMGRRLGSRAALRSGVATCLRSADVDRALRPRLATLDHERLLAIGLDARGRVVREILLAQGGLTGCAIAPRDAFRRIVREAVASFVLVHNHPSGDPTPSVDDARLTERMDAAGRLLGVPMLDHVIVAESGYFSFADAGLLEMPDERG